MSEEKPDLSSFDEIPDRVARAKAKAEAMRKAREGGGAPSSEPAAAPKQEEAPEAPVEAEAEKAAEAAAEPPAQPEEAPAGQAEADLSDLDAIPDRVARAKAKAEAMRRAKGIAGDAAPAAGSGGAAARPGRKSESAEPRKAAPAARAAAPAKGVDQSSPPPGAIRPGQPRAVPVVEGGITTRRGFLSSLTLAWLAFAAASGAVMASMGRLLFPNVLFEPKQTFKVGTPEEYEDGVDTRWKSKYGVWIVKQAGEIYALIAVCTHLGCTPNWLEGEHKFKCPCHGSGYYISGANFEGPAPRPLERAAIYLADDGQIVVDKSRKFQYEKQQWGLPDSFLKV